MIDDSRLTFAGRVVELRESAFFTEKTSSPWRPFLAPIGSIFRNPSAPLWPYHPDTHPMPRRSSSADQARLRPPKRSRRTTAISTRPRHLGWCLQYPKRCNTFWICSRSHACAAYIQKVLYLYAQFSAKTLGGSAPLVHDIVAMVDVVCALSSRVDLGRRWSSWTMEGGRGTPLDVLVGLCRN